MSLRDRFMKKYQLAESGCWQWTASRKPNGYGQIQSGSRGGPLLYAHRVSYELFNGPIPDGLVIDHLCRNRACVNPQHLEAVPFAENVRRGESVSALNRAKTACAHGHPYTRENTLLDHRGYRSCRTCRETRVPKIEV